jgi:radical SAM superfamily enzyme YgiQ (UPF0313 family)
MEGYNDVKVGEKTWRKYDVENIFGGSIKRNRIIGLTFPEQDTSLGLEPAILTVLPQDKECEFSPHNDLFNDASVQYYLCSVYISGMAEFKEWASHHDWNKIVVGGYHPTTFPEELVRYAHKIVQGPCDDFWETIKQEGQIVKGISNHKNIPRYDLYDISSNQQVIPGKKIDDICTSINTSMGCPMKCDFCCSPIMCDRVVSKPIEIIRKEVEYLKEFKPKFLFIRDENFPMQKDWKERLSIIAESGAKIYLFASANLVTEEMADEFVKHNVYMVCLGLEDINSTYVKNKNLDRACEILHERGVMVYLSFIVDPLNIVGRESGKEFYERLLARFEELKPEMVCGNFLMPFRGTALWDKYYHLISEEDYKEYDSKSAFLIKNKVVRSKMEFFMYYYQHKYYMSEFYNTKVRCFECEDTLNLRFKELQEKFTKIYEAVFDLRG